MTLPDIVQNEFSARYGAPAAHMIRSPGRVNLIGEHTDYNQGMVLPLAIEQSLYLAVRPRSDRRVAVHSLGLGSAIEFSLDAIPPAGAGWGEYVKGMAWVLREAGFALNGWEGVLSSDIPIGAGLSSSAALELGTALAFRCVTGFDWDPIEMARLGQRVENEWIGVNSGIMDQMIIALAQDGSALMIDCRSLEYEPVRIPDAFRIVVIDSATRRGEAGLADSAYNDRRGECEEAARWFGLESLRDLSFDLLESEGVRMPPVLQRRARHVLTENRRVAAGVAAMRNGDPVRFGEILTEGHASQRDDFETSRREIDALVEASIAHPACFGARLTGGGFGGCVVSLVAEGEEEAFIETVSGAYREAEGLEAEFYVTRATEGVSEVG
ncbi:MAG TPA: galactokinase [Anaerolineales bacterium]|nr:galactokinase [Anaerolineales bacterium]